MHIYRRLSSGTRKSIFEVKYFSNFDNGIKIWIWHEVWKLAETQAGIKIAGEISITSDMQMILPLSQKAKKN